MTPPPRQGLILLRLFGITKPGLLAITFSVIALWTCIALEKATLRQASLDRRACERALEQLRDRPQPVSEPLPFHLQGPQLKRPSLT